MRAAIRGSRTRASATFVKGPSVQSVTLQMFELGALFMLLGLLNLASKRQLQGPPSGSFIWRYTGPLLIVGGLLLILLNFFQFD